MNRRQFLQATAAAFVVANVGVKLAGNVTDQGYSLLWEEATFDYGHIRGISVTLKRPGLEDLRQGMRFVGMVRPGDELHPDIQADMKDRLLMWVDEKLRDELS